MKAIDLRRLGILVAVVVACGAPGGAERSPTRITRIGDDLLGGGGEVRVADSVVGDVMLSGGNLRFSGTADGSYVGAGGKQEIGGRIAGSVRAAAGNIVLRADVGRNVTLAAGNIVLDSAATITRSAYLAGGTVGVRGAVGQALTVRGGDVTIDGVVGGDVRVTGARLRVGPNARITGSLRHGIRNGRVTVDPGARVAGGIVALPAPGRSGFGRMLRWILPIGFLVAGAVAVALMPRLATDAAKSVAARPGAAAAFAIVWFIGVPILAVVSAVTVVGLPLAVMLMAAFILLLYLGRAAVAVWLGATIMRRWRPGNDTSPVLSFLLGGVLYLVIGMIPVIGPLIGVFVIVFGAGVVLVTLWPRRQHPPIA